MDCGGRRKSLELSCAGTKEAQRCRHGWDGTGAGAHLRRASGGVGRLAEAEWGVVDEEGDQQGGDMACREIGLVLYALVTW